MTYFHIFFLIFDVFSTLQKIVEAKTTEHDAVSKALAGTVGFPQCFLS